MLRGLVIDGIFTALFLPRTLEAPTTASAPTTTRRYHGLMLPLSR